MSEHEHEFYYYSAINEDGWACPCGFKPGEPAGYEPNLDRELIWIKVGSILHDMDSAGLIHISNGSAGDVLTDMVADKCRSTGRYDQYSIVLFIMEVEAPEHAEYWKKIGDGVVSGADPRARCHCGKLARTWTGEAKYCSSECAKRTEYLPSKD